MKNNIKYMFVLFACAGLTACGGGGGSDTSSYAPENIVQSGVFLDSAVGGLGYKTESLSGVTDDNGVFKYKSGEHVTFTLGSIALGSAVGQKIITPIEITNASDVNDENVVKILQLLQSIDEDNNTANGIKIPTDIQENANTLSLNLSNESDITSLLIQIGATKENIRTKENAKLHFTETLKERDSARGTLSNGLVLHMPFTSNAQNISTVPITIDETNVTIDNFALGMKNNEINLNYVSTLEPRSITISFWAKIATNSTEGTEILFALHDGKSDFLQDQTGTMHKYEILKTVINGEATLAMSMSYQEIHDSLVSAQYYVQNRTNILESETWHHFAYTYSPDIDEASAYDSVKWDEATQDYITVHHEGSRGMVKVFYDGEGNMNFIHKTTVNNVDYYELRDMNETTSKTNYHTPTFSFGKFNGSIDDLRIYNRVLNRDEILELSKVRK